MEQVTRSLAAKAFQTSLPLCKETFFSPAMEDHLVLRLVQENFPFCSFLIHETTAFCNQFGIIDKGVAFSLSAAVVLPTQLTIKHKKSKRMKSSSIFTENQA